MKATLFYHGITSRTDHHLVGGENLSELAKFSEQELERIDKQRQDAIKAKGGLPFLPKLELGVNRVRLLGEIPKDSTDPNGKAKKLFTVESGTKAEKYSWSVNPNSPLYRDLLKVLPTAPVDLDVIRTGETRTDTRYSVRIAKL